MKVVVSDLDGTLVDTGINWEYLRTRVRELLGTNHPLRPLGPSILHVAKSYDDVIRAFRIIEEEELRSAQHVSYSPSLVNAIKVVKSLGIKFAVVTLRGKSSAEIVVSRLGIRDYIDILITREQSLDRATQIRMALMALNAEPHEAVFVGDTEYDLNSCVELGVKAFIICDGCIIKCPADIPCDVTTVRSFIDVINYLK